jgi:hypothetical protein
VGRRPVAGLAASDDASVSAERTRADDAGGARLRVGGTSRWRQLVAGTAGATSARS